MKKLIWDDIDFEVFYLGLNQGRHKYELHEMGNHLFDFSTATPPEQRDKLLDELCFAWGVTLEHMEQNHIQDSSGVNSNIYLYPGNKQ